MELSDLIPDKSDKWIINKKFLLYKKYTNVPVCYIQDDVVYLFLDNKIRNVLMRFIQNLMSKDIEFYCVTPSLSNPRGVENLNDEVIKHYFYCYAQKEFFSGFKKIGFDIMNNMVKWSDKNNCYDLVKPNFEIMLKQVNSSYQDWYGNKLVYNYPEEIRQDFLTLYRDIQINKIL